MYVCTSIYLHKSTSHDYPVISFMYLIIIEMAELHLPKVEQFDRQRGTSTARSWFLDFECRARKEKHDISTLF